MAGTFIHEIRAYELLEQVGLTLKPWGVIREAADIAKLGFAPGQKVVV